MRHYKFTEIKQSDTDYKSFYVSDPMFPEAIFGYVSFIPDIMKYMFHANDLIQVLFSDIDLKELAKFLEKINKEHQEEIKRTLNPKKIQLTN